jgi:agmatine/peptidylarginine deiminase
MNAEARPWRLPAEWEAQDGVLMAWPHAGTDWASRLVEVERTCAAIARAITHFETLVLCVANAALGARARFILDHSGVDMGRVRLVELPYDDTWLRDSGPITLCGIAGARRLLDFRFTGWGGKFAASRDDALVEALTQQGLFGDLERARVNWALEGGAIESDGAGTLMTTWQCLHQRHPDQSRAAIDTLLRDTLAAQRVLWLAHGHLAGDDTDAHIDTLARFAPDAAIVYQACDDPADTHHQPLAHMAAELAAFRTHAGDPHTLHPLPWPRAIFDAGRRLPASYANYLIINGAVLVPAYDDPADDAAADVIAAAYPGREVLSIPCRSLLWQNGSLHCMTMQLPAGTLDASNA